MGCWSTRSRRGWRSAGFSGTAMNQDNGWNTAPSRGLTSACMCVCVCTWVCVHTHTNSSNSIPFLQVFFELFSVCYNMNYDTEVFCRSAARSNQDVMQSALPEATLIAQIWEYCTCRGNKDALMVCIWVWCCFFLSPGRVWAHLERVLNTHSCLGPQRAREATKAVGFCMRSTLIHAGLALMTWLTWLIEKDH